MRILGVDPGTHVFGWGLVETDGAAPLSLGHGIFKAPRAELPERLAALSKSLRGLLRTRRPAVLAIEEAFFGRNIASAFRIGEARAVAILAAAQARIEVAEYPPALVKKAVTGNGNASKEQVQAMVARWLGVPRDIPEDAADALAVAICHAHRGGRGFDK